ncbi:unnamed protein product [Adineta steineri]|uniref:Polycystin domain-containing protein n=1 Tax=Adineta steineri TaxID=433720 RepID=A0A819QUK2_9BILA|nr:unnamed protein product [Adineta steineri]
MVTWVQNLFRICEEKHSFEPGWINQTTQVYSSGGYVYEFRGRLIDLQSNLSKLHQLKWIDRQTRAVIIQFNLFTSITLLMEFLSTGSIYPQSCFDPFYFQNSGLILILLLLYVHGQVLEYMYGDVMNQFVLIIYLNIK